MVTAVILSGTLLAAMIDESKSGKRRVSRGYLFGNQQTKRVVQFTDSQDEKHTIKHSLGISNYVCMQCPNSLWKESMLVSTNNADHNTFQWNHNYGTSDSIVGCLVLKRDGILIPSFRDIAIFHKLCNQQGYFQPKILLMISVPNCTGISWIYGIQYCCYTITEDSRQLIKVSVTSPSLSADSTIDYQIANTLHSKLNNIMKGHNSSDVTAFDSYLKSFAATSIHQCVDAEVMAAELLHIIKDTTSEYVTLEAEVAALRLSLGGPPAANPATAFIGHSDDFINTNTTSNNNNRNINDKDLDNSNNYNDTVKSITNTSSTTHTTSNAIPNSLIESISQMEFEATISLEVEDKIGDVDIEVYSPMKDNIFQTKKQDNRMAADDTGSRGGVTSSPILNNLLVVNSEAGKNNTGDVTVTTPSPLPPPVVTKRAID